MAGVGLEECTACTDGEVHPDAVYDEVYFPAAKIENSLAWASGMVPNARVYVVDLSIEAASECGLACS